MSIYKVVTYVVRDRPEFGLMPGFVIMGLRDPCPHERLREPDHDLKTWPEFYRRVQDGSKQFELRRDDREPRFAKGQMLNLIYHEPHQQEKKRPCISCGTTTSMNGRCAPCRAGG